MITGQLKRVIELQDNLNLNQSFHNSNIISLISGKGGTGKTVISLLTSIELSKNKKVLLVDMDLGFPNINVLLNQHSRVSIDNFCFNNSEFSASITKFSNNLHIIFGLSENPIKLNSTKHILRSIVTELKKISSNYDYVILDLGAGIDEFKLWVVQNSAMRIIVSSTDPSSIMDAYALIKIYENTEEQTDFFVVINRCENPDEGNESFLKLNKAVKSFLKSKVELLSIIPENPQIKIEIQNHNLPNIFNSNPEITSSIQHLILKITKYIQLHNINHS
jgi:flagellar biosynthesis protein FlhG